MADRKSSSPPADATDDRAAQKHDLAYEETGGETAPGFYPAEAIPEREGDITPDAADPHVTWDNRVQPERVGTSKDGAMASPDIEDEGDS